jgi:transposase
VVIAHPGKLRIIAESTRKTDKIDARVLAEFLAHDMIPEAWRPTPRVRQHRSLVRRRCKIQSRITSIKNTMRGILTRYNADRRDLFTRLGQAATEKLPLLEEESWLLRHLWEDLADTRQRLAEVDGQ